MKKIGRRNFHHTDSKEDEFYEPSPKPKPTYTEVPRQHKTRSQPIQEQQKAHHVQPDEAQSRYNGTVPTSFPITRSENFILIKKEPCFRSILGPQTLLDVYNAYASVLKDKPYVGHTHGRYIARKPNGQFYWEHPDMNDHNAKFILSNHLVPFYDCRSDRDQFKAAIARGRSQLSKPVLTKIDRAYNQFKQWICAEGRILFDILYRDLKIPVGEKRKDYRKFCPLFHDYTLQEMLQMGRDDLKHVETTEKNYIFFGSNEFPKDFAQKPKVNFSYRDRVHPMSIFLHKCDQAQQQAIKNAKKRGKAPSHELAKRALKDNPADLRLDPGAFLKALQATQKTLRSPFPKDLEVKDGDKSRSFTLCRHRKKLRAGCMAHMFQKSPCDARLNPKQFLSELEEGRDNLKSFDFVHAIVDYITDLIPIENATRMYLGERVSQNKQPWIFQKPTPWNTHSHVPSSSKKAPEHVDVAKKDSKGRRIGWITADALKKVVLNKVGISSLPFERRTLKDNLQLNRFSDWHYRGDVGALAQAKKPSLFTNAVKSVKQALGIDDPTQQQRRKVDSADTMNKHRANITFLKDLGQFVKDIDDAKGKLRHVKPIVRHQPCVIVDNRGNLVQNH